MFLLFLFTLQLFINVFVQAKPYKINGRWYYPVDSSENFTQKGVASWYGKKFHGRKTASGEIYNMNEISAAHKILPMGTFVKVLNRDNNKSIVVRINDRGPFAKERIIDLSYKAAVELGFDTIGTANVKITALGKTGKTPGDKINQLLLWGNYTIQVGSFIKAENAHKLRKKLEKNYKFVHISTFDDGVDVFYRVRVGKCSSTEMAEKYEQIMINRGFPSAVIVAE